jgi:GR25 family glycosyltransferase involved in LPS biosynthesis
MEMGLDRLVFVEDDVLFHERFNALLGSVIKKMITVDCDIIFFYDWLREAKEERWDVVELLPIDYNICTHFVVFNRKCMPRVVELLATDKQGTPLDFLLNSSSVRKFATSCNLVGQDAGISLIDGERKVTRWRAH